jgi:hypothetical protein
MSLTPDEFARMRAIDCYISIELTPGGGIDNICEMALKAAARIGIPARFLFNGVDCIAMPDTPAAQCVTFSDRIMEAMLKPGGYVRSS